jgi:hypothetical protein
VYVAELFYPGVWLAGLDDDARREAELLLLALPLYLADAALALTLFEAELAKPRESALDQWQEDRAREATVRVADPSALPAELTTLDRAVSEYPGAGTIGERSPVKPSTARRRAGVQLVVEVTGAAGEHDHPGRLVQHLSQGAVVSLVHLVGVAAVQVRAWVPVGRINVVEHTERT